MLKIIGIIAVIAMILAALLLLLYHKAREQAMQSKAREVGTVVGIEQTRIPFLARNHIMVTRKGKPYYAFSQVILKKRVFKTGSKVPVVMQPVKVRGETMRIAYILQKRPL